MSPSGTEAHDAAGCPQSGTLLPQDPGHSAACAGCLILLNEETFGDLVRLVEHPPEPSVELRNLICEAYRDWGE